MYTSEDNTIHSARWEDLPPDVQDIFKRWATWAGDVTGKQLFDDSFHRFFFIHEMAHLVQRQAKVNRDNAYQSELAANRITVAYWREKDRAYLTALLARFQRINDRLPVPVPPGQDVEQSFNANYRGAGSNPEVYGWFQTRMVLQAGAERPFRTFSETLHRLVPARNPKSPSDGYDGRSRFETSANACVRNDARQELSLTRRCQRREEKTTDAT